jgi:hypothetical protein
MFHHPKIESKHCTTPIPERSSKCKSFNRQTTSKSWAIRQHTMSTTKTPPTYHHHHRTLPKPLESHHRATPNNLLLQLRIRNQEAIPPRSSRATHQTLRRMEAAHPTTLLLHTNPPIRCSNNQKLVPTTLRHLHMYLAALQTMQAVASRTMFSTMERCTTHRPEPCIQRLHVATTTWPLLHSLLLHRLLQMLLQDRVLMLQRNPTSQLLRVCCRPLHTTSTCRRLPCTHPHQARLYTEAQREIHAHAHLD